MNNSHTQRGIATVWVVILVGLLLTGVGAGSYAAGAVSKAPELKEKDERIDTLKDRLAQAQATPSPVPNSNAGKSPAPGVSGVPSNSTSFASANLGFSLEVPKDWAGQWRYQENGAIGISTASATFFLINKETKYQEVVTIGKIPQAKYDDAKATGQAIGNPDNLLGSKNSNAYVMTFADGNGVEFKSFTYADAVKAARASFKASFKTL